MKLFRVKMHIESKPVECLVEADNPHQAGEKLTMAFVESVLTFPSTPKEVKKVNVNLNVWETQ